MSAQDKSGKGKSKGGRSHPFESWKLTGPWASAWKVFAALAGLGFVGAAIGYVSDPRRFAFSWLFAFITCLTVALGAIFFVLVQRLTSAGWSVTVRRTAEYFGYGILVLIPLFIPVLMSMGHLFPWLGEHDESAGKDHDAVGLGSIALVTPAFAQDHAGGQTGASAPHHGDARIDKATGTAAHDGVHENAGGDESAGGEPVDAPMGHAESSLPSAEHGATAGQEHAQHQAHALIERQIMAKKSAYLNRNFFYFRAALYFLIWAVLAVRLFNYSAAQDVSKDPKLTVRAQAFAPAATFLYALSLTFAAFDWVMSLEPSWFSTIFGVYFFATGVVSSYAIIILVALALRAAGPLDGAVTVEHFHDLGKLMFGFLVFWAYIGFSQFMLIWYAALPEETTWYHNRWDIDPWSKVSMAILLGHFVVPFFWTISRNFKRNLARLQIGAAVLLVMHVVDIYWFVMPNYELGQAGFAFSWIDLACLLAVGGTYGAFVFFRMTKNYLVPIGDPRLERSLHFQNA